MLEKIVLISDTHNRHNHLTSNAFPNLLPDGDLLIHAGDFSSKGYQREVENFIEWCIKQSSRYTHGIVFIAGNHDMPFDPKFGDEIFIDEKSIETVKVKPSWLRSLLHNLKHNYPNIHYLENSEVVIDGVKIWGSPVTPYFHNWGFNEHRGPDIAKYWAEIPNDADIVVTHGPVAYKLDYIPSSHEYVGCENLKYRIDQIKPLIFVAGHIHESYGYDYNVDTHFFNASICNHTYQPINKPWELKVDWKSKEVNII
jgi:Icc-related predicted phosphoesterase